MRVIDSHTEGEPTRVVVSGGPEIGDGPVSARAERLKTSHDDVRRALILEPRGSDVLVGALLVEPAHEDSTSGVIFFNNTGYLGMCGHGAIGVAVTLAWLGLDDNGRVRLETPVGVVDVALRGKNVASVINVPSYVWRRGVEVAVDGHTPIRGHIAWGGNWFFLAECANLRVELDNVAELTDVCWQVRRSLSAQGIFGADGAEIDHVEISSPLSSNGVHSRNFVLCPGGAYDRSPCGTGTSAKLACLADDGRLKPGEIWVQESVTGGRFEAQYQPGDNGKVIPTITGRAWITGDMTVILQNDDPFRYGIPGA